MVLDTSSDAVPAASTLAAIVESAPVAMLMTNAEGTILLANRETERLFGWERNELLGQPVEVLVPETYRAAHAELRAEYCKKPEPRRLGPGRDLVAVRKDGSQVPVEIGLGPLQTADGLFVVATVADITQRKQAEGAMQRAIEQLERSNLELQQFAYIASHDLQEPLRGISGFVRLLQRGYEGKLDERADEWIQHTVESTAQMQRLIHDLLQYARVDSLTRSFEQVGLGSVLDAAVEALQSSIADTGAEVRRDDLPVVVGDRTQLVQLFQNLLGNAIRYQADEPPRVHVSAEKKDGEWLFSVRDNGIGIDPKHHEQIFEVFRRLHTKASYPGTGIGLAICRRVVHRHGGRIWVESNPGQGSTFYFTIPDRSSSQDDS